jgi:hypothetical protein
MSAARHWSMTTLIRTCTLPTLLAILAGPALPDVKGRPVRDGSGPLRELSTNVRDGSGPVYEPRRSIREGNAGSLGGNPVRYSTSGTLRSGPVSEISVGPVTAGRPVAGGGTPRDASAGAVTRDIDLPLRPGMELPPAEPLYDLGSLQEQLRRIEPIHPDDEIFAGEGYVDPIDDLYPVAQADPFQDPVAVPPVEAPDIEDPSVVEPPEDPRVGVPEVEVPTPPAVGAPPEGVWQPLPADP